jgi:hypothetical protein
LAEDLEDLQARYPKSSTGFLKKLRRGEIQAPEGIENVDNPWRIGSSHLSVKPSFELWIRKRNGNCSPVKMNHGNLSAQGALILLSLREGEAKANSKKATSAGNPRSHRGRNARGFELGNTKENAWR